MIFFSNMELRNSFHRKSSEVGAVASMPSPRENIWNCLAVPSTAIAPTCQGQKNHGCHPVTSHIHISAAGSASTAASAAASAKEQPLRVPQHALKSEVTEVPNKTTVSPCFTKHILSHSQVTNKTPPSTKHSTQQRHLAARLRTSFWHRFLSKKLDSIRRFHLRSCEVWKTCRRASHPPQFLPLQQWPPLRTALLLFPSASDMHRMDADESRVSKAYLHWTFAKEQWLLVKKASWPPLQPHPCGWLPVST